MNKKFVRRGFFPLCRRFVFGGLVGLQVGGSELRAGFELDELFGSGLSPRLEQFLAPVGALGGRGFVGAVATITNAVVDPREW